MAFQSLGKQIRVMFESRFLVRTIAVWVYNSFFIHIVTKKQVVESELRK